MEIYLWQRDNTHLFSPSSPVFQACWPSITSRRKMAKPLKSLLLTQSWLSHSLFPEDYNSCIVFGFATPQPLHHHSNLMSRAETILKAHNMPNKFRYYFTRPAVAKPPATTSWLFGLQLNPPSIVIIYVLNSLYSLYMNRRCVHHSKRPPFKY